MEAGYEPYYPVNDEKNGALYKKYKELADKEENVIYAPWNLCHTLCDGRSQLLNGHLQLLNGRSTVCDEDF